MHLQLNQNAVGRVIKRDEPTRTRTHRWTLEAALERATDYDTWYVFRRLEKRAYECIARHNALDQLEKIIPKRR